MLRSLSPRKRKAGAAAAAAAAAAATAAAAETADASSAKNVAVVTGGSGFLGRHIVKALEESGRYSDVVVFDVRPYQPAANDKGKKKETTSVTARGVVGDLTDLASVVDGLKGASVVFHCATAAPAASNAANRGLMTRVNVDGTRHVVEACARNGVTRLVFTSSASVVFDGSDLSGVDESKEYARRPMDYYSSTKIEAEKIVLAANGKAVSSPSSSSSGRSGPKKKILRTVALRPSGIFGEHDALLVPTIVEKAKAGKMKFIIGSGKNVMDWTYAGNVAAAHLAADAKLQQEEEEGREEGKQEQEKGSKTTTIAGRPYFVTNDDPRPFWGFMGDLLEPLGYERPRIKLPFWPLYVVSWLVAAVVALLNLVPGLSVPQSDFSPMRITISAAERRLSCAAARRDFGYEPSVSVDEGVARTVAFFEGLRRKE